MSGARFIFNNAADRATIAVPNTASGMGPDMLKSDVRGEVCRVLASTAQITLTWTQQETVGAVVIPASNLGPSSTIRVRVYADTGSNLLHDTGVKYAAPGGILQNWGFDQDLNVNSFAWGFPPVTAVYFDHMAARKIVIDLESPDRAYIDLSRLVTGRVLRSEYNANYGQSDGIVDLSTNTRAASGDLKTEQGPKAKLLTFTLDAVSLAERAQLRQLVNLGIGHSIFVSLAAESHDPDLERDKSAYGRLKQPSTLTWASFNKHNTTFEVEGF